MPFNHKRSGFTLIELLVVIAIIAILAAILFPVFAQAREKARQGVCLSNLKQIGTAVMMYVQDYDEAYPGNLMLSIPGTAFGTDFAAWHAAHIAPRFYVSGANIYVVGDTSAAEQLYPYVKNLPVFLCPDDPTGARFASGRWTPDKFRMSYWWEYELGLGYIDCKPSGHPHTVGAIGKPALMPMGGDNWTDMHSPGARPPRWNVVYADGHAKFTIWVDDDVKAAQRPWTWDFCNPTAPVDIEHPCVPDCKTASAQ